MFRLQEKEAPRIGVYICHCGTNIAGVVDVGDVVKYAANLPNVVVARDYLYMCSAPAQTMITEDIKEHELNRVVVASCSPRMHELTFRKVCEDAGLNPYLFEMANIREHCSWVHTREPVKATEKAKDLVKMAVARTRLLEKLPKKEVGVTIRALVIGAGVSGLRASLDLAQRGFEVYLIEKAPAVGGRTAQLGEVFPTGEMALDILRPMIKAVASNQRIRLFTNSEVEAIEGFIGNFRVKVVVNPRHVTNECDACRKCEKACPITAPNDFDFGLSQRKAIYLPFEDAMPRTHVIDSRTCTGCGKCVDACERKAVDLEEKPMKFEVDVGTIVVATGYDPYEPPEGEYGYKTYDRAMTLPQLERLMDENGPTKGQLPLSGTAPKSVVFVSCVGSRQEAGIYKPIKADQQLNRYCSRVCCTAALKNCVEIRKKYPDARVFYLYRDIRTYGKGYEDYYRKASESQVLFLRYRPEDPPLVSAGGSGLIVTVQDLLTQNETLAIPADLVVLNVGMVPRADASDIQAKLKIARSGDGFFQEAHAKLRPVDTPLDGIYLAGTAQGPKDITESSSMGSAAAAKAAIPLARGKVEVEPIVAVVDEEICKGCGRCEDVCEYSAIKVEEVQPLVKVPMLVARVTDAQCKGCGSCVVACPIGAIVMKHFTSRQIQAMITAAMGG